MNTIRSGALLVLGLVALVPLTATAQRMGSRDRERNRTQGHSVQRSSVVWSGRIDDVVDVYFQQRRSWTKRVSGRDEPGEARFLESLPRRSVRLALDKENGRGKVYIRQQPARDNDFTCIVRIEDRAPSADRYRFSLDWDGRGRR